MEGLIPLLYKAIKDRRGGRPDGGAAAGVDLYDPEQRRLWLEQEVRSPLHPSAAAAGGQHQQQQQPHRRNLSLEELAGEVGLSPGRRLPRVPLPKARSVRVFSCIGAGAGVAA
ncbi:hypothetical protein OsJ_18565 [Oryza sativa Japonica Group]|uniref:Uncharacterized protein n=1 Tax=Oryza sativa subsp. japonica TaxID=39947 RepID=B9FPM7_ORYSJ|nr:hypothetical protein OsJ_18565 [Oryza sativa Japonica Group]